MKAVVLFSGGLDSTVLLAQALQDCGGDCVALSFDYGQRHIVELEAAKNIAQHYDVPHRIVKLDAEAFSASSLVDRAVAVPKGPETLSEGIPNTYVPARNTIFLSYALGLAEVLDADAIYFGANANDNAGYADCRPEFFKTFQALANVATKQAVEGCGPKMITPLLHLDKADIVRLGRELEAPLEMSWSCYDPQGSDPCGRCSACQLREHGLLKG